jgi:hypothetical protein
MDGERCAPVTGVKSLGVRESKGTWLVEAADQVLLGAFADEAGARRWSAELLRLKTRQRCTVGAPRPSMTYLRN